MWKVLLASLLAAATIEGMKKCIDIFDTSIYCRLTDDNP